jgi:hypothetical protein
VHRDVAKAFHLPEPVTLLRQEVQEIGHGMYPVAATAAAGGPCPKASV